MDDFTINITIPSDDDGYVLLKCPKCGELFKLLASDLENDDVSDIHCPLCGLISENYLTEDVISLAESKAMNRIMDELYSEFKKLERKSKKSFVQIKTPKLQREEESPIRATIDSMEIIEFNCCRKSVKLRNLLIYCGCYCPYCGGKQDGDN